MTFHDYTAIQQRTAACCACGGPLVLTKSGQTISWTADGTKAWCVACTLNETYGPAGSLHRQWHELDEALRELGRAIVRTLPAPIRKRLS